MRLWVVPLYYLTQYHVVTNIIKCICGVNNVQTFVTICQAQYRLVSVSHMDVSFFVHVSFQLWKQSKIHFSVVFKRKSCVFFNNKWNWSIKLLLFLLLNIDVYVYDNHYLRASGTKQIGSRGDILSYVNLYLHKPFWLTFVRFPQSL
jgi:hypothetical protein